MKTSLKSLLLLIAGLILLAVSIYDMVAPEEEEAIRIGSGQDNSFGLYLVIGLTLCLAGIMGFIREAQKQGKRKRF